MNDLTRWNPYADLSRVRESFDRFFAPYLGPAIDVAEVNGQITVQAEIPGVEPGDLNLEISDEGLIISGEIKRDGAISREGYRHVERRYGSFQRSISFPVPVKYDEAVAEYKNGILRVEVPKATEAKSKSLKLRISGESSPS